MTTAQKKERVKIKDEGMLTFKEQMKIFDLEYSIRNNENTISYLKNIASIGVHGDRNYVKEEIAKKKTEIQEMKQSLYGILGG